MSGSAPRSMNVDAPRERTRPWPADGLHERSQRTRLRSDEHKACPQEWAPMQLSPTFVGSNDSADACATWTNIADSDVRSGHAAARHAMAALHCPHEYASRQVAPIHEGNPCSSRSAAPSRRRAAWAPPKLADAFCSPTHPLTPPQPRPVPHMPTPLFCLSGPTRAPFSPVHQMSAGQQIRESGWQWRVGTGGQVSRLLGWGVAAEGVRMAASAGSRWQHVCMAASANT